MSNKIDVKLLFQDNHELYDRCDAKENFITQGKIFQDFPNVGVKKENLEGLTISKGKILQDFPKVGLKLFRGIQDFYDRCGCKEDLEGLTTTQVCDIFIMPQTESFQSFYCHLVRFIQQQSAQSG